VTDRGCNAAIALPPRHRAHVAASPRLLRIALCVALAALLACLGGCFPVVKPPLQPTAPSGPFLGPDDFLGGYSPRTRDARNGAQATYAGVLVVTMMDRALVEQVLPVGLRLATPKSVSTQHPVIYLAGIQGDPLLLVDGATQASGAAPYHELILLIPFVVREGRNDKWHNYAVRMYLDELGPVVIGDLAYGYGKELASFALTGALPSGNTKVFDLLHTLYFTSDIASTAPWQSAASATAAPRWPDLQKIFEMPVLGAVVPGFFVCSYFEWGYANTEVAPVSSTHQYLQPFRLGMGMENWVKLGPLTNALNGAVAMRGLRWRLSLDLPPCAF
jgi:hypothetical protein